MARTGNGNAGGALPEIEDYNMSIAIPALIRDPVLKHGQCMTQSNGSPRYCTGGFCVVYPFVAGGRRYAVRCWHRAVPDMQRRAEKISEILHVKPLPCFVEFCYVANGIAADGAIRPLIRMEWVEGDELKEYIRRHKDNTRAMYALAQAFLRMVATLHGSQFAHGDLQHGNIKVRQDGQIVLVDYDSLYHPSMGRMTDHIYGRPEYQHPLRFQNRYAATHVDHFSEIIIYTSILYYAANPSAYTKEVHDTEGLLFDGDDYRPDRIMHSDGYRALCHCSRETAFLAGKIARMCSAGSLDAIPRLETVVHEGRLAGLNFYGIKANPVPLPRVKTPVRPAPRRPPVNPVPVAQQNPPAPQPAVNRILQPAANRARHPLLIRSKRWVASYIAVAVLFALLYGGYVYNRNLETRQAYHAILREGDDLLLKGDHLDAIAVYERGLSVPHVKDKEEEIAARIETAENVNNEVIRLQAQLQPLIEAYGVAENRQLRGEIERRVMRIQELQPRGKVIKRKEYKPFIQETK